MVNRPKRWRTINLKFNIHCCMTVAVDGDRSLLCQALHWANLWIRSLSKTGSTCWVTITAACHHFLTYGGIVGAEYRSLYLKQIWKADCCVKWSVFDKKEKRLIHKNKSSTVYYRQVLIAKLSRALENMYLVNFYIMFTFKLSKSNWSNLFLFPFIFNFSSHTCLPLSSSLAQRLSEKRSSVWLEGRARSVGKGNSTILCFVNECWRIRGKPRV